MDTEEQSKFLDDKIDYSIDEKNPIVMFMRSSPELKRIMDREATMFKEIKKNLLRLNQVELLVAEQECICNDCEWYDNPGACPDYDESRCKYAGRGEL